MEKQFVLYPEALALKEIGFNEPCFGFYSNGGEVNYEMGNTNYDWVDTESDNYNKNYASIPLYQQVFDWFEDEHNMYVQRMVTTSVNEIMDIEYKIKSWRFPPITVEFDNPYDTFDRDKAKLQCVRELIKIING